MDLATVIEQQQAAIAELRKAIANVKKAPLERRTVEFYIYMLYIDFLLFGKVRCPVIKG